MSYYTNKNGENRITDYSKVSEGDTVYVDTEDGLKKAEVKNVQTPEGEAHSLVVTY